MVAPSAEAFLNLFPPGRLDCFGEDDGRKKSVVKKPLDPFMVQRHLEGKTRVGFFPLSLEGGCQWGAIDVDDAGAAPVRDLVATAKTWGLELGVERSKAKGHHLWLFFIDSPPAGKVRAVLQGLIHASDWHEHRFEVFPKQTQIGKDGFGNYIFVPLHGGSAKEGRTLFLDLSREQWAPYQDQLAYLQGLPRYSETDLDRLIAERGLMIEAPRPKPATNGDARSPTGATDLPLPPCAAKVYAEGMTEPGRSDWAHFLARHFRRRGLPEKSVVQLLLDWNQLNKPEPLPTGKIRDMVHNAYAKEYTSLGCEYLPGAKEICGDACPVKEARERQATRDMKEPGWREQRENKSGAPAQSQPTQDPLAYVLTPSAQITRLRVKQPPGVPTGFRTLDDVLGGLGSQRLITISGRPGSGKTSWQLNVAEHLGDQNIPVLFVSAEMSFTDIGRRRIAIRSGTPLNAIPNPPPPDMLEGLADVPVYVADVSSPTLVELEALVTAAQRAWGIEVVFVDHLGKLRTGTRQLNRYVEVGEITRALKDLAKRAGIPVVAACQLNRAIESGMNDDGDTRRPALADLRDSGNIEEEADQVVFIWGGKRKEIRREQILSVEKNRHGEQKDIRIVFDRARQRIRELPRHGGPPSDALD